MKCSTGVAISATLILVGSALTLISAAAMFFMFLGPMSGQLLDPATLPPGADVQAMRAGGLGGGVMLTALGAFGVVTGIGLIRLWRWTRYATITIGGFVILFSLISAAVTLLIPIPSTADAGAREMPHSFRFIAAGFYAVWSLVGGWFVYFFMRQTTIAQFAGDGAGETAPRVRPLSVSIIAWLMIVSGAMTLPMMGFRSVPMFVLGFVLTGAAAKATFIVYMTAYVVIGIGLLKRTAQTLMPAVGLHVFAVVNALTMLVPPGSARFHEMLVSISPRVANEPQTVWIQYWTVGAGVVYGGIVLYFLFAARRALRRREVAA